MFRTPRELLSRAPLPVEKDSETVLFKCDLCDDSNGWESESEVDFHKKAKHKSSITKRLCKPDVNMCQICFKEYATRKHLIRHIKKSHLLSSETALRVEREIYFCDICSHMFFNKNMLTLHIMYYHLRKRDAVMDCPKCDKPFELKRAWYHMTNHLVMSVASCPICLFKCRSREDLLVHVKEHRLNLKCEMCEMGLRDTKTYEAHIVDKHSRALHEDIEDQDEDKETDPMVVRPASFMPKCIATNNMRMAKTKCLHGVRLPDDVSICVLCRQICCGPSERDSHLGEHAQSLSVSNARSLFACKCGETFAVRVLLKHHVFRLQGDHKPEE